MQPRGETHGRIHQCRVVFLQFIEGERFVRERPDHVEMADREEEEAMIQDEQFADPERRDRKTERSEAFPRHAGHPIKQRSENENAEPEDGKEPVRVGERAGQVLRSRIAHAAFNQREVVQIGLRLRIHRAPLLRRLPPEDALAPAHLFARADKQERRKSQESHAPSLALLAPGRTCAAEPPRLHQPRAAH